MTRPQQEVRALLDRARELNDERDYPALLAELEPLAEEELFLEPELAFLHADVLRRVGEGGRALDILTRLEPVCATRGNDRLNRRRLNLVGSLHFEQGDVKAAEAAWMEVIGASGRARDAEFEARANNNLGVICTLQTRMQDALTHYYRALAAYQRLGYLRGLGQCHHNLAIAYRELGFPREADSHFHEAARFARTSDSEDETARVEQERALLMLLEGDSTLARSSASRALARYDRLEDPAGSGEALRVLGLVSLWHGELAEARASLDESLKLARQCKATLLQAESLEAIAAVSELQGRPEEYSALRGEAARLFRSIHAAAWGAMTRQRMTVIKEGGGPTASP